jgi:hypothetical protein
MKKVVLFLVAVSFVWVAQAQKVTSIYVSGLNIPEREVLAGDTVFYTGALMNRWLVLAVNFTAGANALQAGDSVIIGGNLVGAPLFDNDEYLIDGVSYRGFLYIVPPGGIAAYAVGKLSSNRGELTISTSAVGDNGSTLASLKCIYTSADGNRQTPTTPDLLRSFYLLEASTSVLESALGAVKVFPTLASDELQFTNLKNTDVSIFSLVGQEMIAQSHLTGNVSIDVSSLSNGIYFVKMQNGSAVKVEKIKIVR